MKEEQTKALLKKSALKTTEGFTDNLMEKIKATREVPEQPVFPSLESVITKIFVLMLLLSFLIFYSNFNFLLEMELSGNAHRTKLFAALLLLVLFGINHLLKMNYTSKLFFNQKR